MTHKLDEYMVDREDAIQRNVQAKMGRGYYASRVVKEEWPKPSSNPTYSIPFPFSKKDIKALNAQGIGVTQHTISLKNTAINSPSICLQDIREMSQFNEVQIHTERVLTENLKWMWETTFRNEVIKTISDHSISLVAGAAHEHLPRKISFFGKVVPPYITAKDARGLKWIVNPKYKHAATQEIYFDKDTVHFLFTDLDKWAGEIAWRNILNQEHNPDGVIGFYRVLMTYAAKPVRPDLGRVVTVCPNRLWYWAWKLVGFVP